jgi:ABC-2 type transport system permease protein
MGGSPGNPGDDDVIMTSLAGIPFGEIGVAVLGVLAITSEYGTRMIRTTLAAMPARRRLVAAKAAVVAGIVLVAGTATSVACFLVAQPILHRNGFTFENGYAPLSLADADVLRAVLGTGVILTLLALFALGVGLILRHTAGAITTVLGLLLAPVIAISFLPDRIADWLEKSSLIAAGLAVQQTVVRPDNIQLGPWEGLAVAGAYAAVALGLGLVLIARRDA